MTKKKIPEFFINAFYESKFRDKLFVVKAGGKVIEDTKALDNLMSNIHELTMLGIKVLLVYGGGRALDEAAEKRGLPVQKKEGRRITDKATMDLIKEIIGGKLSLSVNESMVRAGLQGYGFNAVPANWMRTTLRKKKPIDYGFVGEIEETYKRDILRLFKVSDFVSTACLAATENGVTCNINADTIATQLAMGSGADKLIFLSDVDGVTLGGKVAPIITAEEIPGHIKDGSITGGMQVKMENCLSALDGGVRRIHLINGLRKNALYKEIFEPVGPGTMVFLESEREHYLNEVEAQKVIMEQRT